ncbi:Abi family protein [Thomasclavelia spiroformis]|uniref:Abi family protein n=1 Tax=Thomasclavelia spiroformis TaxID=29348 RepID=UPI003999C8C6
MNKQDRFLPGTNFDEITHIHFFDKELKSVLFKYIIESEKHLKSIIAYRFSEMYKDIDYAYLVATNYNSKNILEVTSLISNLSNIIKWQLKDKNSNPIKHYVHNHNVVPFWILTNYMNFGQMVKFYKHLKTSLQNKIAKDFSKFLNENLNTTKTKLTPAQLLSYLENVVELRNIVAHNNRILGFKCRNNTIYLKELHSQYISNPNSQRQDVFNVFIIMQCLLSKNQYAQLHNTIHKRIKNLSCYLKTIPISIILDSIGFSQDWYNNGKIKQ